MDAVEGAHDQLRHQHGGCVAVVGVGRHPALALVGDLEPGAQQQLGRAVGWGGRRLRGRAQRREGTDELLGPGVRRARGDDGVGHDHGVTEPGVLGPQAEVGLGEHGVEARVEAAQRERRARAQAHHRGGGGGDGALPDAYGVAGGQAREEELGVGVVRAEPRAGAQHHPVEVHDQGLGHRDVLLAEHVGQALGDRLSRRHRLGPDQQHRAARRLREADVGGCGHRDRRRHRHEARSGDDRGDRGRQHVVGAAQPDPDEDQLGTLARHRAQPLDGASRLGPHRHDVADQVLGGLAGCGRLPVHQLALEHHRAPVVAVADRDRLGPTQDGYVDRHRLARARQAQQQVTVERAAEGLVEAARVLDRVAAQQGGGQVDRAAAEQLVARAAHGADPGQDTCGSGLLGVREQVAEHLRQPLTAQREERHVVGRAVLEGDVEGAGLAAALTRAPA